LTLHFDSKVLYLAEAKDETEDSSSEEDAPREK
jgi:hypothetical protein